MDNSVLKSYAETLVGGSAGTNTGSAYTVDLTSGNTFHLILNANCIFTFSNPSPANTVCYITILLKQDGTGGRAATWPFTVVWPSDLLEVPATAANTWVMYHFFTINGGGAWWGAVANPGLAYA